ncbi:RNA polymerase sigma factor [Corynebacterium evansiae]
MTSQVTSSQAHDAAVTDLALRAASGDRQALTEFISATHDDVWRLLAHLADTDRADDLTQETYLRVLSALPRFAARSTARTWILSLARRVWVDSVRHDMARPRSSATEIEDATSATPAAETTGGQSWAEWVDTRALIDQLEAERREALILTQVLGYTYAEAAKIANVRVGTIRSRVARARADLVEMAGEGRGGVTKKEKTAKNKRRFGVA